MKTGKWVKWKEWLINAIGAGALILFVVELFIILAGTPNNTDIGLAVIGLVVFLATNPKVYK